MAKRCVFCNEVADPSLSITHRKCKDMTHAACVPEGIKIDYKECAKCLGQIEAHPVSSSAVATMAGREPRPADNVDYVLKPGQKAGSSALSRVASLLPGVITRTEPENVKTSQNPEFLLKNGIPIATILKQNKLGLAHFLKAGITMDDFLQNGYTWNDLMLFEDISKRGPKRALQAITTGLRANANHFRDYADAFPFAVVKAHTKFETMDLHHLFGLVFPVDEPLGCNGDQDWTARHCIEMGLTYDDLCDFGLQFKQQYEKLMDPLSEKEAVAAERALHGLTPTAGKQAIEAAVEKMTKLIDLNAPVTNVSDELEMMEEEEEQEKEEQKKVMRAPRKKKVVRTPTPPPPVVEEEEQEEEEQVVVIRAPIVAPKEKPKPKPKKLVVIHVPPSSRLPISSAADLRNAKKYDRHGALF